MLSECPLAANKNFLFIFDRLQFHSIVFLLLLLFLLFLSFKFALITSWKAPFFVANQSRRSCHPPSLTTCELELNFFLFFCLILFRSVLYLCTFCFQTPATGCPELCPLLFRLQLEKTGRKGRIFPFFICIGQQFFPPASTIQTACWLFYLIRLPQFCWVSSVCVALFWHWSHFDCLFGKEEEEEEVVLTSSVCLCAAFLEKIVHFLGLRCLVGLLFVFLSALFGFLFGVSSHFHHHHHHYL